MKPVFPLCPLAIANEPMELNTRILTTILNVPLSYCTRYKQAGRGFDFRWGHWDFSLT
jgi:hypothetical protein